jgi:hypothetical protein
MDGALGQKFADLEAYRDVLYILLRIFNSYASPSFSSAFM